MRPVMKGASPREGEYPHYKDALGDLVLRIGRFCSYCEQPIQHAPEIEHVQPRSLNPELERSWDNLLLACKSCNTIKATKPVDLAQVAMPDLDNTFRGLVFHQGGRIEVSPDLTDGQVGLMRQIVKLVGLDRHPDAVSSYDRPPPRDERAKWRSDVWDLANEFLNDLENAGQDNPENSDRIAGLIIRLAVSKGFFSVWMTVFRNHPGMLERFIGAFPGTDEGSFNGEGKAIPRPGGRL